MAVYGKPLLGRVLGRLEVMEFLDGIVVATSNAEADDPIAAFCEFKRVGVVRGHPTDVLGRFLLAVSELAEDDTLMRVTADNPFYDPVRSSQAYEAHRAVGCDYTHVDGLSHVVPEFVNVGAFRRMAQETSDPDDREHVTLYLRKGHPAFSAQTLPRDFGGLRHDLDPFFTLDTQEHLDFAERMLSEVETGKQPVELQACYRWLDGRPKGADGLPLLRS